MLPHNWCYSWSLQSFPRFSSILDPLQKLLSLRGGVSFVPHKLPYSGPAFLHVGLVVLFRPTTGEHNPLLLTVPQEVGTPEGAVVVGIEKEAETVGACGSGPPPPLRTPDSGWGGPPARTTLWPHPRRRGCGGTPRLHSPHSGLPRRVAGLCPAHLSGPSPDEPHPSQQRSGRGSPS